MTLGVGFRGLSGPKAPIVLGTKMRNLYCLASSITLWSPSMLTLMDSAAWPKVIKMMVREKRSTEISQTVREARHVNSRGSNTHVWRYKVKSDEPPPSPSAQHTVRTQDRILAASGTD